MGDNTTNDRVTMLNETSDIVGVHEKKKRKNVKRTKSVPSTKEQGDDYLRQVSSYSYHHGDQPVRHVQLPLETMGSREKLIQIHDELRSNHPSEINKDEKDIRKLALHLAITNHLRENITSLCTTIIF